MKPVTMPWKVINENEVVTSGNHFICSTAESTEEKENAASIVRAVNSHDALLQAAKEMFDIIAHKVHGGAAAKWREAIEQAEEEF